MGSLRLVKWLVGMQLVLSYPLAHKLRDLGQTLKFLAPVRPGDMVYAEVKVSDIDLSKRRVRMDCLCQGDGKNVLVGEATILAPSRKFD